MQKVETWRTIWEHPEYGDAELLWTWSSPNARGESHPVLIAIQFGLFVPADEVVELVRIAREQVPNSKCTPN